MTQAIWRQVAPVLVSILVIVAVAVIRAHSRTLAAITATMPITIPLSLWIIWSGSSGDRTMIQQFTGTLPAGILGTLAFIAVMLLAVRAGWRLAPTLLIGYTAWGATLGLTLLARLLLRG
jgi:hypothetical protein